MVASHLNVQKKDNRQFLPITYLCKVRKTFVYILLPVFLFNSSLGEVFKLDKFVLHFSEHLAANTNITVFDFVYMHYLGDDQNTSDQDKDMELPFKKMDEPFSFEIASFPESAVVAGTHPEVIDHYLWVLFRNNRSKAPILDSLFRPPRLV
jgi:hypothetical protein